MNALLAVAVALIIIAVLVVASAVRVLREYERGVIFRLGRLLLGTQGPGPDPARPVASTGWSRPTCAP